ncbi:hypothetical protein ACHAWU_008039 [Discostella pseudostelligera]|uniref:C2 domain-containing protein n=1 Tax=Discostella pseudostelligera TaxID=259834 RepID=A0ABD3N7K4_9STRA
MINSDTSTSSATSTRISTSKPYQGRGPHRSFRHIHHQRGTIGTFHIRLLEGRNLQRKHWSALGLGVMGKTLGLSRSCGEVSSFGTMRLAFWDAGGLQCSSSISSSRDFAAAGEHDNERSESGSDVKLENFDFGAGSSYSRHARGKMEDFRTNNQGIDLRRRKAETESEVDDDFHSCTGNADNSMSTNNNNAPFMPYMPQSPSKMMMSNAPSISPFDQAGSLRAMSPARSPFFPAFAQSLPPQQQQSSMKQPPPQSNHNKSCAKATMVDSNNEIKKPHSASAAASASSPTQHHPSKSIPLEKQLSSSSMGSSSSGGNSTKSSSSYEFGPRPPHHYAREQFKSSTVHNDSNPIWGDNVHGTLFDNDNANGKNNGSTFRIPLQKDDFSSSSLHGSNTNNTIDGSGTRVALEIRLDEEMTPTESLLVSGALSTAVGAAASVTSVVGMGKQVQDVSHMGMEMLGLGTDRLIGRGYVDLMPLLLGLWEECWEESSGGQQDHHHQYHANEQQQQNGGDEDDGLGKMGKKSKKGGNLGGGGGGDNDSVLNEYGRIHPHARGMKRRVERMGMLDVWVPLYHPSAIQSGNSKSSSSNSKKDGSSSSSSNNEKVETSGMIHLLISYEPNGMSPKKGDVVAFETFARRPPHGVDGGGGGTSSGDGSGGASENYGPIITPIVPPLSPLIVIDNRGPYLLLEYATSRTVTSVNRNGNVKSSRWERSHRVRIHRNAIFVIERHTLLDAAGDISRLPGDIVLSTPVGREVAEISAPIVAGVMELMGPALLWGKLVMAMGGTGVRAGLAGARAATEAVVNASQEKALERREQIGGGLERGEAGLYSSSTL